MTQAYRDGFQEPEVYIVFGGEGCTDTLWDSSRERSSATLRSRRLRRVAAHGESD